MADQIRFGVLGCADIAWRRMLPVLTEHERVVVTAIASRSGERAARFTENFGGEPVTGYPDLLARDDVDAIYLPLPAMLHDDWIERALRAGKHVLAEKPLTGSGPRSAELLALARQQGLVLLENAMFLYHSQHTRVAERLADGTIGELRSFASSFTIPPRPDDDIRYQADVGGGALLDVGFYPLRAALLFLGPQVEVLGAVLRRDRRRGVDIAGSALLVNPDGVSAALNFGMDNAYRCDYELSGSTGRLWLDRCFTPPADYRPTLVVDRQGQHREELPLAPDDQFVNALNEFLRLVHGGTDTAARAAGSAAQGALLSQVRERARVIEY